MRPTSGRGELIRKGRSGEEGLAVIEARLTLRPKPSHLASRTPVAS